MFEVYPFKSKNLGNIRGKDFLYLIPTPKPREHKGNSFFYLIPTLINPDPVLNFVNIIRTTLNYP